MSDVEATLLYSLDRKVDELVKSHAELKGGLIARVDQHESILRDHEDRVRRLEKFRFAVPSSAVLAALATVGTLVYYVVH